jgi:hypothetical protein
VNELPSNALFMDGCKSRVKLTTTTTKCAMSGSLVYFLFLQTRGWKKAAMSICKKTNFAAAKFWSNKKNMS